jgi:hypothetical protein
MIDSDYAQTHALPLQNTGMVFEPLPATGLFHTGLLASVTNARAPFSAVDAAGSEATVKPAESVTTPAVASVPVTEVGD